MTDTHVLVVDDQANVRQLLLDALEQLEVPSESAANGLVALQRIQDAPPKAIILDLMMPEMDGFSLITRLQGDRRLRHIPIIVMSAAFAGDPDRYYFLPGVVAVMNKTDFSISTFRELLLKAGIVTGIQSAV
ncbi:MAG: response regulator [Chloroflexi bacterium]|nr:response regulator [Chloroflexota bacterium]